MGEIELRGKVRALRVRSSRGAVVRATSSVMALAIIGAWVGWGGASAGGGINRPTKNPAPSYNAPSAPTLTATPSDSSASLSTTAFSGDAGDTHASSDWWITRESTPSDTVWSAFTSDSLTSYANAGASIPLATDTTYVAHVRHTGSLGGASAEAVDTFTTTTLDVVANEPVSYTRIVNRHFNSKAANDADRGTGTFPDKTGGSEGWDGVEWDDTNFTIETDATAPVSPSNVGRSTLPAGSTGGTAPIYIQTQTLGVTSLYASIGFQISANWQGHNTGTNKFFFVKGSAGINTFLKFKGSDSNPLAVIFNMQGTPDNAVDFGLGANGDMPPNVSGYTSTDVEDIQRGQWYWLEIVAVMNDVGSANGTLDIYLGKFGTDATAVHTHSYTGLTWRSTAESFGNFSINPTWGGGGDTSVADQWINFDYCFVSGS